MPDPDPHHNHSSNPLPDPLPNPTHPSAGQILEIRRIIASNAPNHPLLTATDQVLIYVLLQTKHMLNLEIITGLKHSKGSTLKALNHTFGTSFTRKQQAFDYISSLTNKLIDPIVEDPA